MLIAFYQIDLWQIFSSLFWILGASILLITLSIHDLLAGRSKIKRKEIIKTRSFRKYAGLGILMLLLGFVLSLLPVQTITAQKKVVFIDQNSYEPDEIEMQNVGTTLLLSNRQLDPYGSWKISGGTVILYENGYIETPFIDFKPGLYEIEFEASGSKHSVNSRKFG
jgi:hypothetical protein